MPSKNLRPKGAIGIYILNSDYELLLFLRKSKHANGTWCPPGGHIEYGESFLEAAKRETLEESGIEVQDIELLGVTSDVYLDEKRHYITVHTKPVHLSGEPRIMEPEKFEDMRWFKLNSLPENLFPANKHFFGSNPHCLCGSKKNFINCHGLKVERSL